VGCFGASVGDKVAEALDRGQSFNAVIEHAFPNYVDTGKSLGNGKFKIVGAYLDLKVEYLLEKGQPAIDTEKCWRCIDAPEKPQTARSFFTTVAGVTFEGRQRIITRCSVGERLILVRDPSNPHDNGAIKIMRLNGEQLGFIPAHVSRGGDSSGLAYGMDHGDKYSCRISDITGGGSKSLGVNIEITDEQLATAEAQPQLNATPAASVHSDVIQVHSYLWWWIGAAVVLLVVIVFIAQKG
jgi:hypothetical protein